MNKSRMKLWKKMIAAILAVTLLATSVDLQLLAAPVEEAVTGEAVATEEPVSEETEDIYEVAGDEETEADAKILSEVEAEREESSKTFLMSDGTFMVAQYGIPVHYEDENEEWQEIDNTLIEEADTEAAVMATDTEVESSTTDSESENGYTTTEKAGERDRIKFSKKLKEGKTVSIKNTEFPVSWGIKDAQKQTVQIIEEVVYIDGVALEGEAGMAHVTLAGLASKPIVLGPNEYFVLGDNRDSSEDSRFSNIGNVKGEEILGRVWLRVAPFSKFGKVVYGASAEKGK